MRRNLEKIKPYLAVCKNAIFPASRKKLRDSVILADPRVLKAKKSKQKIKSFCDEEMHLSWYKREDVVQEGVIMEIEVLLSKGAHSGLFGHYKLYVNPDLGVRKNMP